MARSKRRTRNPKPQTSTSLREMNAPPDSHKEPVREDTASHGRLTTYATVATALLIGIQTIFNSVSIRESGEQFATTIDEIRSQSETLSRIFQDQQRARLSFRLHIQQIEDQDPPAFRIVSPFAIGGTTEARRVVFKNYYSVGPSGQQQYMDSVDLDWDTREGHPLSDVSPTETDRRFVAAPFTPQQLATIVSEEQSLYFIGRLEYCDIYGVCRYFMRCAEMGNRPNLVSYCGTQIGDLADEAGNENP